MSYEKERQAWTSMKQRCSNPKNIGYQNYGGRGITVCSKWKNSFTAFINDMGPKPSPKHSLSRNDNEGNYTPENCCWATREEQQRNRRNSIQHVRIPMKKLHPEVQNLLVEIEKYCARSNTDPTNFGIEAINDGHLVRRLYLGRVPKLNTIDRIREFIERKTKAVPKRKVWRR